MKLTKQFLTGFLVAAFVGAGGAFAAKAFEATQTVSGGGVSVAVTYVNPRANEAARFQVALNTHTVALEGYDLKTLALMRDGAGKTYTPTKVENKGGGHHRQVTLTFPKIPQDSKRVEVIIKGIGGVKERSYRWALK